MMRNASRRSGFTLIEILVAIGIFTAVIVAFIAMFVAVSKVQVQQSSSAEVNQQSQFLLQQIQYYVQKSSVIDMVANNVTGTLRLRMPASSSDPTVISLSGGMVYIQQQNGALQPLTSNRVTVSNLSFTKRANPPSHDSVDVSFTVSYNTTSLVQAFSQILNTSVARVSAATFDSNLLPSSTATYSLGASGQVWTSVNNVIYFSGSNVGIGVASPQQTLEINGGLRLNTTAATSTCNSSLRGTLWFAQLAPSSNDTLQMCIETTSSTYTWVKVY